MNNKDEPAYAAATFEQQSAHIELDYGSARRIFVFGDVHGNIDPIRRAMKKVDYDHEAGDRMIGLGDWLDRGDHTTKVAKFIDRHTDNLVFVKGNHEQMLEDAVRPRNGGISPVDLIRNGGSWILDHLPQDGDGDDDDRDADGNLLMEQLVMSRLSVAEGFEEEGLEGAARTPDYEAAMQIVWGEASPREIPGR